MRFRYPKHLVKFRTIERDGEKRVIPIVERKRIIRLRGARHGVLPKYSDEKIIPRVKAAKLIRHDTVLELNAGTGTVSAAYKFPKKMHILVDKYAQGLETAKRKLRNHPGEVKAYAMNNTRFIRKHLAEYQGRITLLDVDPYGCPGETLQLFFKHYQVDRPMIVNVTDGSVCNWISVNQRNFYKDYLTRRKKPKKEDAPQLLDELMNKLGERHHFKVKKLYGAWKSDRHAYYASYLIKPA